MIGISFDIAMIGELFISARAFEAMRNLQFLRVYQGRFDVGHTLLHIPTNMNFPPCLRLLRWPSYPNKCLPSGFQPEYLVELNMSGSNLQKLWEGTKVSFSYQRCAVEESLKLTFFYISAPFESKADGIELFQESEGNPKSFNGYKSREATSGFLHKFGGASFFDCQSSQTKDVGDAELQNVASCSNKHQLGIS